MNTLRRGFVAGLFAKNKRRMQSSNGDASPTKHLPTIQQPTLRKKMCHNLLPQFDEAKSLCNGSTPSTLHHHATISASLGRAFILRNHVTRSRHHGGPNKAVIGFAFAFGHDSDWLGQGGASSDVKRVD